MPFPPKTQQADLHEDAFELQLVELAGVAVLVGQAGDLLPVAVDFASQRAGDHGDGDTSPSTLVLKHVA